MRPDRTDAPRCWGWAGVGLVRYFGVALVCAPRDGVVLECVFLPLNIRRRKHVFPTSRGGPKVGKCISP